MSAHQADAVADTLIQHRILTTQQANSLHETRDADEQVTPFMLSHVSQYLAHFHGIILGLGTGLQFLDRVRDLVGVHMFRIGTVFDVHDGVDQSVFQHSRGKPADHAAGTAAGAPTIRGHVPHVGVQVLAQVLVVLHASLRAEQIVSDNVLVG